jgi:hypothetical protein
MLEPAGVAVSIKKPGIVPGRLAFVGWLFGDHKVEYDLVDLSNLRLDHSDLITIRTPVSAIYY